MRRAILIAGTLVVVQGLLLLVYFGLERTRGAGPLEVERPATPAPELSLGSSDGADQSLSELRGSTVVLHFWATWCPPCREELPSLLAYASTADFEVIAVSVDENWDAVRAFVGDGPMEPIRLASSEAVSNAFGVDDLPQTFVIDPAGGLCLRFRGPQDWSASKVRETVAGCDG